MLYKNQIKLKSIKKLSYSMPKMYYYITFKLIVKEWTQLPR